MFSARSVSVFLFAVPVLGILFPAMAGGQVLNPPERESDRIAPLPADRTSQELAFMLSLLGAYDETADEGLVGPPIDPELLASSYYSTFVEAGLDYRRGRGRRSFALSGRGGVTFFPDLDVDPSERAVLTLNAATDVGSRHDLLIDQDFTYDALYAPPTFVVPDNAVPGDLPTLGPGQAVARSRSFASISNISLARRWSRRNSTALIYSYSRRDFQESEGLQVAPGNNSGHSVGLNHDHVLSRNASLTANYTYATGAFTSVVSGTERPLDGHAGDVGFEVSRRLSATRALRFSLRAGATYSEAVSGPLDTLYDFWAPSGQVEARVDLGRTWVWTGSYGRAVSAVDGLTGEVYLADTAGASVGGRLGPRVNAVATGAFSRGEVGANAEVQADYESILAGVELQFVITRELSLVAQYEWYRYDFGGDALPLGYPPSYERNGVRVGATWRLPLITPRPN